jgi:DNA-binding response OmpR family regulator
VDLCAYGNDALSQGAALGYDVVILDWMLPDLDGVSVLRAWRAAGLRTPVLMLTARGTVPERVQGLRAGADDYHTTPFDFEELLARKESVFEQQLVLKIGEGADDACQVGAHAPVHAEGATRQGLGAQAARARKGMPRDSLGE